MSSCTILLSSMKIRDIFLAKELRVGSSCYFSTISMSNCIFAPLSELVAVGVLKATTSPTRVSIS
jgi:hypothetical protein